MLAVQLAHFLSNWLRCVWLRNWLVLAGCTAGQRPLVVVRGGSHGEPLPVG
jgi:hypothetical protein